MDFTNGIFLHFHVQVFMLVDLLKIFHEFFDNRVISVYAIIMLGLSYNAGTFYWIGTALFIALLLFQHLYVTAKHFDRIGPSFGLLNGLTSVCFAVCAIIDLYLHYHSC